MSMKKDIVIDEIRCVRHEISSQFGHDTKALSKHYGKLEEKYKSRILKEPIFILNSHI